MERSTDQEQGVRRIRVEVGVRASAPSASSAPPATLGRSRGRHQVRTPAVRSSTRGRNLTPRDVVMTGLVSLGLCVGVVLVTDGMQTPKPPPQPTAAQAFQARPPIPAAAPAAPAADRPATTSTAAAAAAPTATPPPAAPPYPLLAPAAPTRIRIASINVDAPLTTLALDAGRHLIPPPERDRNLAGWYRNGVPPGSAGAAVIAGHVDTHQGPAVFYNLGALKRDQPVLVDRADGVTAVFTVDAVEAYDASAFPTDKVYGRTGRPELRVITCGAGFDKRHNRYMGNVVVYAHLTATQPRR